MRQWWRQTFIYWLILWFCVVPLWGELPKRPFIWADDESFKPLIYRNDSGRSEGIFYDVLTELFGRMQIPLENRLYPWARTQKIVQEGKADGMVTIYTQERQKFLLATDPLITVEERAFVSRNNPKYQEILKVHTLEGLKPFVVVETSDAGWSKEHLKGMHVIWVPTAKSALNMVATGRADVYLMSNFTGPNFVKDQIRKGGPLQESLKAIVMGNHSFTTMEYRLLIRKNSPFSDIIEKINPILHQMHKDGTFQKIIQRYHNDLAL